MNTINKPFLKWAGSKTKISAKVRALLPEASRLIEPFVGSAAIFLNTHYERYLLADSSPDLINVYKTLQQTKDDFIKYAKTYFTYKYNNRKQYLLLRDKYNSLTFSKANKIEKAALFLYLNRHGFNGLMRCNKSGGFNVPFGYYKKPYFPEQELHAFLDKLAVSQVDFVCQDFSNTLAHAGQGDVIYCDPPYAALSNTANFTSYSGVKFTWEDQEKLWAMLQELASCGIPSVISNHDLKATRLLYQAADIKRIQVRRYISCKGHTRGKVSELLVKLAA